MVVNLCFCTFLSFTMRIQGGADNSSMSWDEQGEKSWLWAEIRGGYPRIVPFWFDQMNPGLSDQVTDGKTEELGYRIHPKRNPKQNRMENPLSDASDHGFWTHLIRRHFGFIRDPIRSNFRTRIRMKQNGKPRKVSNGGHLWLKWALPVATRFQNLFLSSTTWSKPWADSMLTSNLWVLNRRCRGLRQSWCTVTRC